MSGVMHGRQAAQKLGVHENTLRRWEARGSVQAVRLPSGVRRFRPEGIKALREQKFSGFAPPAVDEDVVDVRAMSVD